MQKLRAIDLFRQIPKDLTEASKFGGLLSIVAVSVLVLLCILEFQSLRAVQIDTRIQVSHREDEEFQVNLNVTFPAISCEWLNLDYVDVVGHRKRNITKSSNQVHKHTLHGTYVASAVRAYDQEVPPPKKEGEEPVAEAASAEVEVFVETEAHVELDPSNFQSTLDNHRLVIVNFFAPWCPYCIQLAPIWRAAAEEIKSDLKEREIVLASVDCVKPGNQVLCHQNHIQVFPTLRVYRDASDNPLGRVHMHEEYRGQRSTVEIKKFVEMVWTQVSAKPSGRAHLPEEHAHVHNSALDKDGKVSGYSSYGCIISGSIPVSRIPGTILFTPAAQGHNFHIEGLNMSHVINHLSFGRFAGAGAQMKPKKKKRSKRLRKVEDETDGAYADEDGEHSTFFMSLTDRLTHEHYVKIVQGIHQSLWGYETERYEYTVNSNIYKTEQDDLPEVKVSWDIWPMEILTREHRKPLIEGLCQLIGFLGGVFTFFMMFHGVLRGIWAKLIKEQEGKLG